MGERIRKITPLIIAVLLLMNLVLNILSLAEGSVNYQNIDKNRELIDAIVRAMKENGIVVEVPKCYSGTDRGALERHGPVRRRLPAFARASVSVPSVQPARSRHQLPAGFAVLRGCSGSVGGTDRVRDRERMLGREQRAARLERGVPGQPLQPRPVYGLARGEGSNEREVRVVRDPITEQDAGDEYDPNTGKQGAD